jgi:hypothetical protein
MYILLGKHADLAFDPTDLATGGLDLVGAHDTAPLEPLD